MRVSATVEFAGLERLIDAAEKVDSPEQIRREAEATVPMVESLYILGFERTEAPDGSKWAPPKHDYGHPLMRDTRALQQGATVTAESEGVRIKVSVPGDYDQHHQHGTDTMVARKIVPDTVLGERWARQIGIARVSVPPRLP